MGGTRFIGVYLTKQLVTLGHEVVLFNRGKKPSPVEGLRVIQGDRTQESDLQQLANESFDAIFDNNGRELSDTQPLAEIFKGKVKHFIYMSSAGVYLKSDQMPHVEGDAEDPKSRHKGKNDTESYLAVLRRALQAAHEGREPLLRRSGASALGGPARLRGEHSWLCLLQCERLVEPGGAEANLRRDASSPRRPGCQREPLCNAVASFLTWS